MPRPAFLLPLALLMLVACQEEEGDAGADTGAVIDPGNDTDTAAVIDPGDTCGAAAFADLVGEPRSAAEAADLPPRSRIIAPGDAVTQDYVIERLNVHLDAEGRVERVDCG